MEVYSAGDQAAQIANATASAEVVTPSQTRSAARVVKIAGRPSRLRRKSLGVKFAVRRVFGQAMHSVR